MKNTTKVLLKGMAVAVGCIALGFKAGETLGTKDGCRSLDSLNNDLQKFYDTNKINIASIIGIEMSDLPTVYFDTKIAADTSVIWHRQNSSYSSEGIVKIAAGKDDLHLAVCTGNIYASRRSKTNCFREAQRTIIQMIVNEYIKDEDVRRVFLKKIVKATMR